MSIDRSAASRRALARCCASCLAILAALPAIASATSFFGLGVRTDLAVGGAPTGVVAADLNGDGNQDLVTVSNATNTVGVRLGSGTGAFGALASYPTGSAPYGLAVADLNGDGRLDIVTTNSADNTVSVLLGDGSGGFGPRLNYATGGTPYAVTVPT